MITFLLVTTFTFVGFVAGIGVSAWLVTMESEEDKAARHALEETFQGLLDQQDLINERNAVVKEKMDALSSTRELYIKRADADNVNRCGQEYNALLDELTPNVLHYKDFLPFLPPHLRDQC